MLGEREQTKDNTVVPRVAMIIRSEKIVAIPIRRYAEQKSP